MTQAYYIQVLLPLRLDWEPWYTCPEPLETGKRVMVRFAKRSYTAVVRRCTDRPDMDTARILSISAIAEDLPPIRPEEFRLWEFLADYYLCTLGEVFKAAYPDSKVQGEREAARKAEAVPACGQGPAAWPPPEKPGLLIAGKRLDSYLPHIRRSLAAGRDVLLLIPEIKDGGILKKGLEQAFPGQVLSYTSRNTAAVRRKTVHALRGNGAGRIVIGTRSAIFLPFSRLGLIIVDNEQDTSYKQADSAPRLHARDAAVVLGSIHKAEVLLGSACPSLESLQNVRRGKYRLLPPPANPDFPAFELIDISEEKRKNGMLGLFSRRLLTRIMASTGSIALIRGWEKEDTLQEACASLLPGREIRILTFSEARHAGLSQFGLVGVMQADFLNGKNGFRGDERAIQSVALLRELCAGTPLVIQTAKSDHRIWRPDMESLLRERRDFHLPPFTRLIDIHLLERDPQRCAQWTEALRKRLPEAMEMPTETGSLLRLAFPPDAQLPAAKRALLRTLKEFGQDFSCAAHLSVDVDPL
ncbi:MAG: hypothetical protein J5871_05505 [Bacteroidales bacterium]|nr:hypothetical protein [Bacteroidales bacterium]